MQGEDPLVNAVGDNVDAADPSTDDNSPIGDGRRTRWTGHRQRRRVELIQAAIAAIVEHGPDVDMSHVAREAGVSKPVLYRYFTDKSQLWVAVGEHVAHLVVEAVTPAVAAVTEERALIASTVDAYLGIIEATPELYRFLSSSDVPGIHHVVTRAMQQVAVGLARVIGDRLRALGLDSGAAEPWAHGMVGMVQAVGDWWISRDQPVSRPALSDYLTTLLWEGVAGLRTAAARHDTASPGVAPQT
jgi:AcrR family transcriptional regulator